MAVDLAARFPMLVESCKSAAIESTQGPSVAAVPSPQARLTAPPIRLIERPREPPVVVPQLSMSNSTIAAVVPFAAIVAAAGNRHGVDPRLIDAVIKVESGHDPKARSNKGARGLMQLMPATARRFGIDDPALLYEPAANIDAGTRYLALLIRMFGDRLDLALAAYNAGEGAVVRHGYRIPPYAETRNYVSSVLAHFQRTRKLVAQGQ